MTASIENLETLKMIENLETLKTIELELRASIGKLAHISGGYTLQTLAEALRMVCSEVFRLEGAQGGDRIVQPTEASLTLAQRLACQLLDSLVQAECREIVSLSFSSVNAAETSITYLKWMCQEVINNSSWDEGKANRWIGYIQGVMTCQDLISINIECDRVRQAKTKV